MIKVYQIQLTDAEIDAINRDETFPKHKAFFNRSFDSRFKAEDFQYYTHVANLECDDFDEAFELMNLWENESLIERLGPCSSMSVGDILERDGERYRVASWGFTKI